jgi:hypothetical protein
MSVYTSTKNSGWSFLICLQFDFFCSVTNRTSFVKNNSIFKLEYCIIRVLMEYATNTRNHICFQFCSSSRIGQRVSRCSPHIHSPESGRSRDTGGCPFVRHVAQVIFYVLCTRSRTSSGISAVSPERKGWTGTNTLPTLDWAQNTKSGYLHIRIGHGQDDGLKRIIRTDICVTG